MHLAAEVKAMKAKLLLARLAKHPLVLKFTEMWGHPWRTGA